MGFAAVTQGRERCSSAMPRHRHRAGYVCLVLSGGYEEAGDHGRFRVGAGDVVFHKPFDAHLDRFAPAGAEVLNFELDGWDVPALDLGRVADADAIARLAERDARAAREALLSSVVAMGGGAADWPDELARELRCDPNVNLGAWATARGLAAATVSRGFHRVYDVTPAAFRLQMRAHRAWRGIMGSGASLAAIAAESGFADQAHMTRAVSGLTGRTPARWRRAG